MSNNTPDLTRVIPSDENPDRDAIHVAVVPMICNEDYMEPGAPVRLAFNSKDRIVNANYGGGIGIISPWMTERSINMRAGDKVWVLLNPGSIIGLRHDWTHPALDTPAKELSEAEAWLDAFAERWGFDYNHMIAVATNPSKKGDYGDRCIVAHDHDLHSAGELGHEHGEFWHWIEVLTGKKYDTEHRELVGWSCSC